MRNRSLIMGIVTPLISELTSANGLQPVIVLRRPWLSRVIAWFILMAGFAFFLGSLLFLPGLIFGLAEDFGDHLAGFAVTSSVGVFFFSCGVWMLSDLTTTLTFLPDHVSVRRAHNRLFSWFRRTIVISKEEAKSAFVSRETYSGVVCYEFRVMRESGKTIKLYASPSEDVADQLAQRFRDFGSKENVMNDVGDPSANP